MIAIIDYGVGNLFSLKCSLAAIGADTVITSDKEEIEKANKIILPGVGAYEDAARKLKATGLDEVIKNQASNSKPVMGICLGMQLLFEKSFEYGEHKGLGLIKGEVRSLADVIPSNLKIPHMGWNQLNFSKDKHYIFKDIEEGDCAYFVHSFCATNCDEAVIATTPYGAPITAAVAKDNVCGCQFHPEKSGNVGLSILKAFCDGEVE